MLTRLLKIHVVRLEGEGDRERQQQAGVEVGFPYQRPGLWLWMVIKVPRFHLLGQLMKRKKKIRERIFSLPLDYSTASSKLNESWAKRCLTLQSFASNKIYDVFKAFIQFTSSSCCDYKEYHVCLHLLGTHLGLPRVVKGFHFSLCCCCVTAFRLKKKQGERRKGKEKKHVSV